MEDERVIDIITGGRKYELIISLFINEYTVTFEPDSITVSHDELLSGVSYNISIYNAEEISNIEWYYNGIKIGTNPLTLSLNNYNGEGYFTQGNHVFTVFFEFEGSRYSTDHIILIDN